MIYLNSLEKIAAIMIICLLMPISSLACEHVAPNGNGTTGNVTINDFSCNIVNGTAPLGVEFTSNVSGNVTKWCWIFGDKKQQPDDWYSQHAVTAKHTFKNPGTYNITLEVYDKSGKMASLTKIGYITVNPKPFSKCIDFTVTGKCIKSITFDFGDGTQLTTKCLKVTHKYTSKGTFKVKINVIYQNGNCKQLIKTVKVC